MGVDLQHGPFRVAAAALFVAVFVLLLVVSDPVQATAVLFVVPVAMLALSDGVRGGALGALVASALTAGWLASTETGVGALGWASRLVAFAVIGLLVGRYEDLARRQQRRLLDERYAAELHDRVVQRLVIARYQLGAGDDATATVDEALSSAKEIIGERLGAVAPGDLRLRED